MPGPGMELIGDEEIQAATSLLESGYLLRYGSADNPDFQARVYTLEREIAGHTGSGYGSIIAHHLGRDLQQGFCYYRVDFPGHNRRAGLNRWDEQFADAAVRPGTHPADVIGNFG